MNAVMTKETKRQGFRHSLFQHGDACEWLEPERASLTEEVPF